MKQNKKPFLKKTTAALTSALLCVSAVPTGVFAADGYSDVMKAALERSTQNLAEDFQKALDNQDLAKEGANATWTLTLNEMGQALLGSILSSDFSWFQNVKVLQTQKISDTEMYVNLDILMNDTKIGTLEYLMDMENMEIYMRVPEISDSYLKISVEDTYEDAVDDTVSSAASMQFSVNLLNSSYEEYIPEPAVIADLLNRYGAIILDHMENQESTADTLTVADVSLECNVYEGVFTQELAQEAVSDVLTTAKEDEQIKELIEKYSELSGTGEDIYGAFTESIDGLLAELESEDTDVAGEIEDGAEDINEAVEEAVQDVSEAVEDADLDTDLEDDLDTEEYEEYEESPLNQILDADGSYFSARVWADENGEILGHEISACDPEGDSLAFLTIRKPVADGKSGLLLSFTDGTEEYTFSGSGETADGGLNGSYALSIDDEEMLNIEVTDYNYDSEADTCAGTYTVTLAPALVGEDVYQTVKDFALVLAMDSTATAGNFGLSLVYGGADLAALTLDVTTADDIVSPGLPTENILDATSDEDMNTYMESVDLETILTNLVNAGVPEDVLNSMLSSLFGTEDDGAVTDEAAEDTAE